MKKTAKAWEPEESAILLEGYLAHRIGGLNRKKAIEAVSEILRAYACNGNATVDAIFRNQAGITFQMASMESAYIGKTVFKPATRAFARMVDRYKKDRPSYVALLEKVSNNLQRNNQQLYKTAFKDICTTTKWIETCDESDISIDPKQLEKDRELSRKYPLAYPKLQKALKDLSQRQEQGISIPQLQTEIGGMYRLGDIQDILDSCSWANPDSSGIFYRYSDHPVSHDFIEAETFDDLSDDHVEDENEDGFEKKYDDTELIEESINVADAFALWMKNEKQYAEKSANSYVSAIRCIESLLLRRNMPFEIYGLKGKRLRDLIEYLKWDAEFISIDKRQHHRLNSAINKYKEFTESSYFLRVPQDEGSCSKLLGKEESLDEVPAFNQDDFVFVLMQRYRNGMQFDSVDFENFRSIYNDLIGEELIMTDQGLELCLKKCGVLFKGRLFPAEGLVNNNVKEKLLAYISQSFENGNKALYYKAIFSDMSNELMYCYNLVEPAMLKAYLEFVCEPGAYYFFPEFMSREKKVRIDHAAEVEDYLLSAGKPLSYGEIYAGLSHISKDVVYVEIKSNPNIILNEKEHYYHQGIFEISEKETDQIRQFINEEIEEQEYSIWAHVFARIKEEMPIFIENNVYLSSLGIRNAMAKRLSELFNFEGQVISRKGQPANMASVFRAFGEHNTPFTDDELFAFAKEVNDGVIYFDALSEHAVRVGKNLFVSKDEIIIDIEATDKALSTFLVTGYLPIREIDSFLVFPYVGYEWNQFLLESYLLFYSEKYSLVNNGRSLNNVAGAVVVKGQGFDAFVDICADVIAHSDCILAKNKALDYLAQINMLTRRSYYKIDEAIAKAKQIRDKRG